MLSYQALRELRPLIQLLEEQPVGRQVAFPGSSRPPFDDSFFRAEPPSTHPFVDIVEEENSFAVEAELPGVKKEDLKIQIGDRGRSLTIQGSVIKRNPGKTLTSAEGGTNNANAGGKNSAEDATSLTEKKVSNVVDRVFTKRIWLPQAVDAEGVCAKLEDGILTVTIPKAVDKGSITINVD